MLDASATTLFVWFVRLALPLLFFVLWYRQPKDQAWVDSGPKGNVHSRSAILALRKVVQKACAEAPAELATMRLAVDESERSAGISRGVARRDRGDRSGARERKAPRDSGRRTNGKGRDTETIVANLNAEERKHLESLLNYVALNRKEQEDLAAAPSSPLRKAAAEPLTGSAKANAEAQSVLQGSIDQNLGKSGALAQELFAKLSADETVQVEEDTFSSMIDACLHSGDLKGASDFLLKMETAGFCPDSKLLDKVMDLYSQCKVWSEDTVGGEPVYAWSNAAVGVAADPSWASEWAADASLGPTAAPATFANASAGSGTPFNFDAYSDEDE